MATDQALLELEREDLKKECDHFLETEVPRQWQKIIDYIILSLRCLGGSSFSPHLLAPPDLREEEKEKEEEEEKKKKKEGKKKKIPMRRREGEEEEEEIREEEVEEEMDDDTYYKKCCERVLIQSRKPLSFGEASGLVKGFVTLDGWRIVKAEIHFPSSGSVTSSSSGSNITPSSGGRQGSKGMMSSQVDAEKTNIPWVLTEVQSAFNIMCEAYRFATRCRHFFCSPSSSSSSSSSSVPSQTPTTTFSFHSPSPSPSPSPLPSSSSSSSSSAGPSASASASASSGPSVEWRPVQEAILKLMKLLSDARGILGGENPHLFIQRKKLPLFSSSGQASVWQPVLPPDVIVEFGTDDRLCLVAYVILLQSLQHRPSSAMQRSGDLIGRTFYFRTWLQVKELVKTKCDAPTIQLSLAMITEIENRLTQLLDMLLALRLE